MLYELSRFHKLSISTKSTLWLHCVFSKYGGKNKFNILVFLVDGNNRNKSIIILLEVEYVST